MLPATLSVVIPVYQGRAILPETLPACRAQTVAAEWLFVDDGSTDGTADWLEAALEVPFDAPGSTARLLRHPHNRGRAAARNTGYAATTGDVVCFLDADVAPAPDWLAQHAQAHDSPAHRAQGVAAVLSRIEMAGLDVREPYQHYLAHARRGGWQAGTGPLSWHFFITTATSVRRSALEAVRESDGALFNPAVAYGEDLELGLRLAKQNPAGLVCATEAVVRLYDHSDLAGACTKQRQFGASLPALLAREKGLAEWGGFRYLPGVGMTSWRRRVGGWVIRNVPNGWVTGAARWLPGSLKHAAVRVALLSAAYEGFRSAPHP